MKNLFVLLTSSIAGFILVLGGLFSVPLGLFTAYVSYAQMPTWSIFNGLCSIFVPYYGLVYSVIIWIFY